MSGAEGMLRAHTPLLVINPTGVPRSLYLRKHSKPVPATVGLATNRNEGDDLEAVQERPMTSDPVTKGVITRRGKNHNR